MLKWLRWYGEQDPVLVTGCLVIPMLGIIPVSLLLHLMVR